MAYPDMYVPLPEIRRGIQLDPLTTNALYSAQRYRDRYQLDRALGLTTALDSEGVELFVAQRAVRLKIREIRQVNGEPVYLQNQQIIEGQIEGLITNYRNEYPKESNRPHHIERGVNEMLTQAEAQRVSMWPRRARQSFMELGSEWRARLAAGE